MSGKKLLQTADDKPTAIPREVGPNMDEQKPKKPNWLDWFQLGCEFVQLGLMVWFICWLLSKYYEAKELLDGIHR